MVNFIRDFAKVLKKNQTSLLLGKQGNTGISKHLVYRKIYHKHIPLIFDRVKVIHWFRKHCLHNYIVYFLTLHH